MISDFFSLSLKSLRRRKLRSWLTMLGIIIGIAAVVSLISLGEGLQDSINKQFEMMGANKLIITPGRGMGAMTISAEKLTSKDFEVIKKTKGVDMAAEIVYSVTLVESKDEAKQTFIIGLPTDETSDILKDMQGSEAEKGRDLKEDDRDKAVIGYLVAKDKSLFERGVELRDKIVIRKKEFRVVGIMKQIGNPQDDSQIYIPLETAKEILGKEDEIDSIYVQVKDGFNPQDVAENLKKELRKARDEKQGGETFSVQTFEQLLETFQTIFGVVQAVLVGIAAISLLVGGVGIMNTMYTSVLERTREIGTMKAVGARNSDVLIIFLIESGMLGLVGGAIGVVIGIGLAKGAELIAAQALGSDLLKASLNPLIIFGALAFSFIAGCVSGVAPAYQASRLKPVDALRYE